MKMLMLPLCKVMFRLSIEDILNSSVYKGRIEFANLDQRIEERMYQRRIILTARYNFGSQQIRAARNRSTGIESEMERAR